MGIETALLGVSIGLGVWGSSRAKSDARKNQRANTAFDARSAKLESKAILEEADLEAIEIRREGELLGKKQTAYTAKAGLKLGKGTAKDIQEETVRLTEKDVSTTLESAQRKSKQLLETYPEGGTVATSRVALDKLKERSEQLTALEEGNALDSNNFIKSKNKNISRIFGGI